MAQEIDVKIKVDTSQAVSGVNKLEQGLKGAKDQSTALGNTMQGSKQSEFINKLADGVGKLNPAFGTAIQGANGLITKFIALAANPVGAVLAAIVVSAKFLYEAFQSSVSGGKELKAIFAGITAVGEQVKDAIFGLGRALINVYAAAYKFITLDFKGAAESMKEANREASNSYKQLGNAVDGTTAKIVYNLTKQQQANDKAKKLQAVTQSETNKLLVQSREILTDETASINAKKKALAEVTKAEISSSKEKTRIAAEDLRIIKERAKALGGEAEKKMKGEIRDATIALNEAETENAMTGIKLNKQRKMLGRQEVSDAKEASDAKKAIIDQNKANAKLAYDADKTALEEKLKEEGLSFKQRRDLIKADLLLNNADRKKLNDQINKEEQKSIDDHNKAIADLNKRYDDEKANRLADTAVKKEQLDYDRKVLEIENLAQTELEKQTLIEKLNGEHLARMATAQKTDADKIREEKLAQLKTDLDNENTSFEEKKKLILDREKLLLENLALTESQRTQIRKDSVTAQMQIDDIQSKARIAQANEAAQTLTKLSDLAGKDTAAGKALGIASALINTYVGASEALKQKSTLPSPFDVVAKVANVATVLATGFKTVKAITSVKVPGGGGGGGAPASISGISAPSAMSPSVNVVGASSTNAIADTIAQQGQKPIKAYVVANDVTTQQSLDRNIVSSASIG